MRDYEAEAEERHRNVQARLRQLEEDLERQGWDVGVRWKVVAGIDVFEVTGVFPSMKPSPPVTTRHPKPVKKIHEP